LLGSGRLEPFLKLALLLLDHLDGILSYCRTKVPLGVVEGVNGNIKRDGVRLFLNVENYHGPRVYDGGQMFEDGPERDEHLPLVER
jgi:hypothetical protein